MNNENNYKVARTETSGTRSIKMEFAELDDYLEYSEYLDKVEFEEEKVKEDKPPFSEQAVAIYNDLQDKAPMGSAGLSGATGSINKLCTQLSAAYKMNVSFKTIGNFSFEVTIRSTPFMNVSLLRELFNYAVPVPVLVTVKVIV